MSMPHPHRNAQHLAYLPLLIANVILSVLFPPLLVHFLHLSVFDQIPLEVMLGFIVFVAISMVEILFYSKYLFESERNVRAIEVIRNDVDIALHNIKEGFRSLGATDRTRDVMYAYFFKKLESLEFELAALGGAKELRVDAEHLYLTDAVLGVFEGRSSDVICAVHRLKYSHQLLDAHEVQWLRKVNDGIKAGRIRGIKRLMLYLNPDDLKDDAALTIISAHQNSRSYDYRVLDEEVFGRLLVEYGIDKNTVDFAVYAGLILYKAFAYGTDSVAQGAYTKDQAQIDQYTRVFTMCWSQGRKLDNSQIKKGVTMESLLQPQKS